MEEEMNENETTSEAHFFEPIVTATRQPDGSLLLEFDWTDSYLGVEDDTTETGFTELNADSEAVCTDVDRWVQEVGITIQILPRTDVGN